MSKNLTEKDIKAAFSVGSYNISKEYRSIESD